MTVLLLTPIVYCEETDDAQNLQMLVSALQCGSGRPTVADFVDLRATASLFTPHQARALPATSA